MATSVHLDDCDIASPARARDGARISAKLVRNPMINKIASDRIEIYWRANFMSAQECAAMRAMIDRDAQPSTLFSGSEGPEYRTSYSCHLDAFDPFVTALSNRIVAMMGIDGARGETIQGQRYTAGQEYREHCDYFTGSAPYWPRMRAQGGQRCWTAMIYVSPLEAGGETWFPHCEFKVPPREGMILIWNNLLPDGTPNPSSLHSAKPVVSGTKYVLTKWFRERAWDPDATE
ncbi:MAG: 2OG-Fe(II) oxygenase [Sphingobium sp.]